MPIQSFFSCTPGERCRYPRAGSTAPRQWGRQAGRASASASFSCHSSPQAWREIAPAQHGDAHERRPRVEILRCQLTAGGFGFIGTPVIEMTSSPRANLKCLLNITRRTTAPLRCCTYADTLGKLSSCKGPRMLYSCLNASRQVDSHGLLQTGHGCDSTLVIRGGQTALTCGIDPA